ncbi:hypothetical protein NBH19_16895 [Rhizobium sp. S95]|uniref:Rap1a immunity protein domain-containing protein n=1 Tax=Ciceribacter sichuanensis TaxID=2949647 RepID=A0AAJ1C1M0_9HYPH|nr:MULTISPECIES: hypothetical protein [unclassified Ciceribacter]MCM2397751.1 hypothetical protein [Ciceribacter sp. S95]MCO5960092.1 hypothetical protein [Ciceribacter sp. S101]
MVAIASINGKNILKNTVVALPLIIMPIIAGASDFTTEKVLKEMGTEERASYLAGVVEGLAYARYAKDGKKTEGMTCIYDWFYKTEGTPNAILTAFQRFTEYTPGAVMAAMIEKECGS